MTKTKPVRAVRSAGAIAQTKAAAPPAAATQAPKAAKAPVDKPQAASTAPPPAAAPAPLSEPTTGKLGLLVGLLRRPEGASIHDLADATGWQLHSVRGALAGALKKRGFTVTSEKPADVRIYRLPSAAKALRGRPRKPA